MTLVLKVPSSPGGTRVGHAESARMPKQSGFKLEPALHDQLVVERLAAKKSKDFDYAQRLRVIILLGAHGKKRTEVAQMLDVSESAVYLWLRKFRCSGIQGLRDNYKPRKSNLTDDQREELRSIVIAGPEAAGLDTGTWTAAIIRDVIEKRFGVTYSTSAVLKILHRLNFSPQLPQVQLARADPLAQKKWVEKTYPAILRRSRKEGGVVFFSKTNAFSSNRAQEPEPGRSAAQEQS